MDLQVLKKKLSVYHGQDGCFKNLSNEILYELVVNWESWDGSPKAFYTALGTTSKQMASAIGRAKRYKREGRFGDSEFKEIVVQGQEAVDDTGRTPVPGGGSCSVMEFVWPDGRMVRFSELDKLLVTYYDGLTLFLADRSIPMHNMRSEQSLRNPVVGRKIWYGTHSPNTARDLAKIMSLVESCKFLKTNPREYIDDAVDRVHQGLPALSPYEYKQAKDSNSS